MTWVPLATAPWSFCLLRCRHFWCCCYYCCGCSLILWSSQRSLRCPVVVRLGYHHHLHQTCDLLYSFGKLAIESVSGFLLDLWHLHRCWMIPVFESEPPRQNSFFKYFRFNCFLTTCFSHGSKSIRSLCQRGLRSIQVDSDGGGAPRSSFSSLSFVGPGPFAPMGLAFVFG